jgi:hypothetical protein
MFLMAVVLMYHSIVSSPRSRLDSKHRFEWLSYSSLSFKLNNNVKTMFLVCSLFRLYFDGFFYLSIEMERRSERKAFDDRDESNKIICSINFRFFKNSLLFINVPE